MKLSTLVALGVASRSIDAFTSNIHARRQARRCDTFLSAYELEAEPEGGDELIRVSSSMEGSRMKNMGEVGDGVYNFWLTGKADGGKIKSLIQQTEKEASRKANFPGFRKGQIPPYAMPQIRTFAIQEALIKTCEESLEAYGLESLPGSDGSVTINEKVEDIVKGYKVGSDVEFTATYKGKFDSNTAVEPAEPEEEGVVDVEAVALDN
ncbi:hypothetical protein THAOC_35700 [Thalassiosira oceanica]|uniref:Trigger factor ribosome-binding bacterial domain-containing protein n=1 Tax=Thalassiosira oceanica TaxID=159749 RepID=K0R1B8_THAOC|nr:hypothetical protein THAOC_35700 [Thalassiosira oceanica]|mmetsp:Transcript_9985/g.23356  ORF Transcript_9985/g.23356 Transcript_9985/m.23356 type:complete len:208 (-) Transcript_9985:31-654(-)|eukprot:EJK45670.1 hypothetical protein THAOC_35700 [Thalassiosira oceanica]